MFVTTFSVTQGTDDYPPAVEAILIRIYILS